VEVDQVADREAEEVGGQAVAARVEVVVLAAGLVVAVAALVAEVDQVAAVLAAGAAEAPESVLHQLGVAS
jgi:hypothetical protein